MKFLARSPRRLLGAGLFAVIALIFACSDIPTYPHAEQTVASRQSFSYQSDIKPILENRCMACHGCYDAPCQLKLTSAEGIKRGASLLQVYDAARLEDMPPTRLGTDAHSEAQWREQGFFSVLHDADEGNASGLDGSLLFRMLELAQRNPLPPNSRLPDDIKIGTDHAFSCPTLENIADYAQANPHGGMPYATTGLSAAEFARISQWIAEGAVTEPMPWQPSAAEQASIERWEAFFNQRGQREQLVARYLFEHLFVAHIHFPTISGSSFYELVRSSTPPGEPIMPLRTVRPNDAPDKAFYYRLRPLRETLVEKTHITYGLDDQRMQRWRQLFLGDDWDLAVLPGYGYSERANPFATFNAIPAKARYQFMLDTAEYFVRTFIRGPVCRGQVATDVIRDQFWTVFEDPSQEAYVNDPLYRSQATPLLGLPGQNSDLLALGSAWLEYNGKRNQYLELRGQHYAARKPAGASLDEIWDGDGYNQDALLTIFRHHDSASVRRGLWGRVPDTIWVMDYPLLERTYYELVVNFNVFGSLSHQAQTRLYFDLIRNGAEHNFLRYVPAEQRQGLYDQWYQGQAKLKDAIAYTGLDLETPTTLSYSPSDRSDNRSVMRRFAAQLAERGSAVAGTPDTLNRCPQDNCQRPDLTPAQQQIQQLLRPLAQETGASLPVIPLLPEVSFLRVTNGEERWVYSLVHNRAHANVAFMFGEEDRLLPQQDDLTIMEGTLGSYPNFSFDVELQALPDFVAALQAATDSESLERVADRWGVRRTHPQFWEILADFQQYVEETDPVQAGLFDINRYQNL
ncbi:fatty acid cis/trans isomerase [Halopseudomonas maritima]|uniref:fatty acid cis/trans isomerase n=1 Tax=Halopseudomonas maritima TaxID=2918528 RepID=UPI001EEA9E2E|nr:fatty acid cis/trans isomerase [Halopseudomonas maritima]UJJ31316.1 fatty acid cis/trans isomerase [Halopseudomonas maritima]